jgi:hypothetical protein
MKSHIASVFIIIVAGYFFSQNKFTSTLMLGLSLKVQTYNAPADTWILTSYKFADTQLFASICTSAYQPKREQL